MPKHVFRSYVIAVDSNDDFEEDATHVAIELRPSTILWLAYVNWIARLIRPLIPFYHLDVDCKGLTWLNFNPVDEDFPEAWEAGAVVESVDPALLAEGGLIGDSVALTGDARLIFSCSHKHSGTDYTSHEVALPELVRAIRWRDVAAELRERLDKIGHIHRKGELPCASTP